MCTASAASRRVTFTSSCMTSRDPVDTGFYFCLLGQFWLSLTCSVSDSDSKYVRSFFFRSLGIPDPTTCRDIMSHVLCHQAWRRVVDGTLVRSVCRRVPLSVTDFIVTGQGACRYVHDAVPKISILKADLSFSTLLTIAFTKSALSLRAAVD